MGIGGRGGRGGGVRGVWAQRVNPTSARDLGQVAIALVSGDLTGVVHAVADGCCGWDEFARATLAACGVDATVEPVTSAELVAPASRPLNGCLASIRTSALRPWREGLEEWWAQYGRQDA